MKKATGPYPSLTVDGRGASVVPNAGVVLLLRTAQSVGLTAALTNALRPWQRPLARHRPGKVVLDLAVALAVGGDCLADISQLRAAPEVFGSVASDPTVSRPRWRRSPPPAPPRGRGPGHWLAPRRPTTAPTRGRRW